MEHLLEQIISRECKMKTEPDDLVQMRYQLSQALPQEYKKVLLELIDQKDLQTVSCAYSQFKRGFCLGIQLVFDLINELENPSPFFN